MRTKVKITKVSYYPWEQGGLRFHFAHKQYDTETGNYVGSYAPGLDESIGVLQKHEYTEKEIRELFERTRKVDNYTAIPLPKPIDATMIL